ncbi:MAG: lipid-A-disaccharide synthase [Spirochaetaceae bacterium]|nr:lipid-A-disaccharide synthase [Myxococcales bacterium]MCB9723494.1 lipid-A-disaccharide synthase [Spirochaetaceae bacterium]
MTTILISAGDVSGDRHAARVVRRLRARRPDLRFVGMGGAAMAEAGVELAVDQRRVAVGGLVELLGHARGLVTAWRTLGACLESERPELVVLIDSGGFHLPFARRVRAAGGARILYAVAPQIWAWRPGRLRKLVARTERIAVVLPFEVDFYAAHGVAVDYVGHPALDGLPPIEVADLPRLRTIARAALGLPAEAELLGLFPGSRPAEWRRHLPLGLETYGRLRDRRPGLEALVVLPPNLDEPAARALAADGLARVGGRVHFTGGVPTDPVPTSEGANRPALDAIDVALAKPGTVTLELLARLRPMVVTGRVHPLTAWLAGRSLRTRWLALPNLVAGAEIVPERLQTEAEPERLAEALEPLFEGPLRERMIAALGSTRARLDAADPAAGEGASERVARIVEEMLEHPGA